MSTFAVNVVRIGEITKHPWADSLSITKAEGNDVVVRTGDFKTGDLAIYVPLEAVVDTSSPRFQFLSPDKPTQMRIKAKKMRGIPSMGLLVPADPGMVEGQEVSQLLGITKYEEPVVFNMNTDQESPPNLAVPTYGVEQYKKYSSSFMDSESIIVTEKVHGSNSRFVFHDGRLWAGSHNTWRKRDDTNVWWAMAVKYDLESKLAQYPSYVFYGEVFGKIQDLTYGAKTHAEDRLMFFDIFDSNAKVWLDWKDIVCVLETLSLPIVPILYEGPYNSEIEKLKDGNTTVCAQEQIREGIVIRSAYTRYDIKEGFRMILKLHGDAYLLRKGGTEFH